MCQAGPAHSSTLLVTVAVVILRSQRDSLPHPAQYTVKWCHLLQPVAPVQQPAATAAAAVYNRQPRSSRVWPGHMQLCRSALPRTVLQASPLRLPAAVMCAAVSKSSSTVAATQWADTPLAQAQYAKELDTACLAVQLASKLCRTVQQQLKSSETAGKQDDSPVTVADYGECGVPNAASCFFCRQQPLPKARAVCSATHPREAAPPQHAQHVAALRTTWPALAALLLLPPLQVLRPWWLGCCSGPTLQPSCPWSLRRTLLTSRPPLVQPC